ncbi:MAG TPA: septum site-determining protein MinD [Oligoflexia bacterium]|nr:septum site-determining protein MinD [Oligoflexia bacterium]HMP26419.1 septum site-determining protein MinD [Oligoflexia bacterium]
MNIKNGINKKSEGEIYVVTSGKGGVGKTTTTASLGAALALRGKRVLVVDADIGLRNLDVILGLENRIVFNLVDVAKQICKPSQALIKSKKSNNLFLLPASQTDDKDVVTEDEVRSVLDQFRREFHFILVDSPAGIEQGFRNACAGADKALVITTPEIPAIRDADRVIGLLSAKSVEPRLIINRIDFDMVRRGDMLSVEDVQDILGIELLGVIERDENVIVAANNGEPVAYNPKSKAGQAFSRIAGRMCGEDIPIEDFSNNGFWGRLTRRLGVG